MIYLAVFLVNFRILGNNFGNNRRLPGRIIGRFKSIFCGSLIMLTHIKDQEQLCIVSIWRQEGAVNLGTEIILYTICDRILENLPFGHIGWSDTIAHIS